MRGSASPPSTALHGTDGLCAPATERRSTATRSSSTRRAQTRSACTCTTLATMRTATRRRSLPLGISAPRQRHLGLRAAPQVPRRRQLQPPREPREEHLAPCLLVLACRLRVCRTAWIHAASGLAAHQPGAVRRRTEPVHRRARHSTRRLRGVASQVRRSGCRAQAVPPVPPLRAWVAFPRRVDTAVSRREAFPSDLRAAFSRSDLRYPPGHLERRHRRICFSCAIRTQRR
mmetsp:Transcript_6824/g.17713  ORF Transcript_6824/g.17713 Transcript_6824/m.17713 type:complete len:231 (+) Transcript_6824:800-1492(+)